jgi:flagellar basal body-associated protein FliL
VNARGRVLLILAPLVLLVAGGGAAYWFYLRPGFLNTAPKKETCELALSELTVNLADQDRPHYLSASVTVLITGVGAKKAAEELEAQVRDAVIMATSQHAYSDLLSGEGKAALKEDIRAAVAEVLAEEKLAVEEVLFTSFIMD